MKVVYKREGARLILGSCLDVLTKLPNDHFDSIVTDPPYGLEFMGKSWDRFTVPRKARLRIRVDGRTNPREGKSITVTPESYTAGPTFQLWCEAWACEALRVLKPGGHMLAFGSPRTYHRMAAGVEDAGFEIRDCIAWMYGSGFPKSHDISKAIDKGVGAEREVIGSKVGQPGYSLAESKGGNIYGGGIGGTGNPEREAMVTAPTTPDAERWQGWGTALKPAFEPIVVARKPFKGTVAANVLEYGTGALNVDQCRIGRVNGDRTEYGRDAAALRQTDSVALGTFAEDSIYQPDCGGRWPANVILDEEAGELLDAQTSYLVGATSRTVSHAKGATPFSAGNNLHIYGDNGGASRFFYCAKAARKERNAGMPKGMLNDHPTVKPLSLMRYLVRLVTPPDGIVVDPFLGSGTTGAAAALEGFKLVGIENDEHSMLIAGYRIHHYRQQARK